MLGEPRGGAKLGKSKTRERGKTEGEEERGREREGKIMSSCALL